MSLAPDWGSARPQSARQTLEGLLPALVLFWVSGVLLLSGRLLLQWRQVRSWKSRHRSITPGNPLEAQRIRTTRDRVFTGSGPAVHPPNGSCFEKPCIYW